MPQEEKSPIQKGIWILKEFWFIALLIGSIITGWTSIDSQVKYQEARITALESKANDVSSTLSKMASDLAYIRGKLEK